MATDVAVVVGGPESTAEFALQATQHKGTNTTGMARRSKRFMLFLSHPGNMAEGK